MSEVAERCKTCGDYLSQNDCYFDHGMMRWVCKKPIACAKPEQAFPEVSMKRMKQLLEQHGLTLTVDTSGEIQLSGGDLLLTEAIYKVRGDRADDYGDITESFKRIADIHNSLLDGRAKTHYEFAIEMIALKLVRLSKNPDHYDSMLDIIGYVICYRDIMRNINPDEYTAQEDRFRHEIKNKD